MNLREFIIEMLSFSISALVRKHTVWVGWKELPGVFHLLWPVSICFPQILKLQCLLLLLLSCFSHVWLCATPEMAAHQAPPSLGFSRQEHWSGLPFPSPTQESETWKWSCSVVSDSSRPRGLQPTRLLCPWDFPGKSTGVGCHCLLHTMPEHIKIYFVDLVGFESANSSHCPDLNDLKCPAEGNDHWSGISPYWLQVCWKC